MVAWILTLTSIATVSAHTNGASAIHEVKSVDAPTASLKKKRGSDLPVIKKIEIEEPAELTLYQNVVDL